MKLPVISGIIDRRMLINFRADPSIVEKLIVGICLILLKKMVRVKGFPAFKGIGSESAAHRIAVNWTSRGVHQSSVYIPRRNTSSILNSLAGGRFFPGVSSLHSIRSNERVFGKRRN